MSKQSVQRNAGGGEVAGYFIVLIIFIALTMATLASFIRSDIRKLRDALDSGEVQVKCK